MSAHNMPMILRARHAGHEARVNREFEAMLGLTRAELEPQDLFESIHPEDQGSLRTALDHGTGCAKARHRTASGGWVDFDWHVKQHDGETVALGLHHDPIETAAPREEPSPSTLRGTMADTLDAMARVVEVKNPGMRCSILLLDETRKYVTVGAGPNLPAEYNALVEGLHIGPRVGSCGTAAYWNIPVVVENIHEDPLWAELREAAKVAGVSACWSQPITTINGDVLGAMALYDDAPRAPTQDQMDGLEIAARMVGLAVERDRLEEQLRHAAKLEALGVLAGGIAHDFNNLLVAILGNAELAASVLPPESAARNMVREIVSASENATDLCNQMLAFAGRGTLTREAIEVNAIVREIGGLLKIALSKKAALVFDLNDEPLGVVADRSQFRQVVMNLITNAAEAIGDNSGEIAITTSSRAYDQAELVSLQSSETMAAGEYVTLCVRDTGAGMTAETKARIYDPFFTTKTTGRGLGLAAVKGIVHGHAGTIALDTELGVGTTFLVLIPREPIAAKGAKSKSDTEVDAASGRILLVDDERMVRDTVKRILEHAGYEVVLAKDGQEAIEVFRREYHAIDAVLLDVSMPKLSGVEVLQELRMMRPDVPVILSSGFTEQQIMDRFRNHAFTDVVQKPTRSRVLLSKLAELIAAARSAPSLRRLDSSDRSATAD